MTSICVCRYPLLVIDRREGDEIKFIAMPIEVIGSGKMPVPDIDFIEQEGLDGITRQYVLVRYRKLTHNNVKKYDVSGHVVIAGCESSVSTLQEDGKLKCETKEIYEVLHPMEEWVERHLIELS